MKPPDLSEFYGHAAVLRRYAGVPDGVAPIGQIQHGWCPAAPGVVVTKDREEPLWVWNSRTAELLSPVATSKRTVTPIGSPYVYLDPAPAPAPDRGVLAVPLHSIAGSRVPFALWLEYARQLRSEFGKVAVLLHENDVALGAEAALLLAGVLTEKSPRRDNPNFLFEFRKLIRGYKYLIFDRLCTAMMYALYENREVLIRPSCLRTEPPDQYEDLVSDPWFIAEFGLLTRERAAAELGLEYKRSPEWIRKEVFGVA